MRFPEFSGEWEETTLGKISEITKGSGISKDQLSEQGSPCILYGELYTKYKSEIIGEVYSRTELDSSSLVKSKANDVIIPCSGETAIDISTARCVPFNNILLGGDLNIIRLKNDDGGFFAYQLNGVRKTDIARVAQGVSVVHLYGENLKQIIVYHPAIEEQKKITRLLSLIDERIATQNKIIEKLESLIKGLRHLLFESINGDITTLSKIANVYQPQTISSTELTETGYNVYGANGIIGKYHSYNHENEQICITCRGNTCGTVNYTLPKSWITGNAMVVNSDEYSSIIDKRYLYHYLCSMNFQSIISGSGQPQIVRSPLEKLKIVLPTMRVQQKVALCLDSILYKTRTEKAIVKNFEEQRQHLLRQMFI